MDGSWRRSIIPAVSPTSSIQISRGAKKDHRGQNCLERRQVDAELALGALPELDRGVGSLSDENGCQGTTEWVGLDGLPQREERIVTLKTN